MASLSVAASSTGRSTGSVGRALALFAAGLVLCVTILVATAGPAAGLAAPAVGAARPAGHQATPPAPGVDAREFGIPLALLAGIGIFLVISSQARSQGSKMADAPLRPGGTVRFPEAKR